MKTIVVANPRAAAGKVGRSWFRYKNPIFDRFGEADVHMTEGIGDATGLVRNAIDAGAERIVVVGGDGTLNEAINGYCCEQSQDFCSDGPELVFLPAGTGGDFARALGIRGLSPRKLLGAGETRKIDVGRIELMDVHGAPKVHHFVNIASLGASAVIVDSVNNSSKRLGGRLSFLLGTLKGLMVWKNRRVHLKIDDSYEEEMQFNTIVIANGRSFGGGMKVAPTALIDDGQFDIIAIRSTGPIHFAAHAPKIYTGRHLQLPECIWRRGETIRIEPADNTPSPIAMETDGELPGYLPMKCLMLHHALRLFSPWALSKALSENL